MGLAESLSKSAAPPIEFTPETTMAHLGDGYADRFLTKYLHERLVELHRDLVKPFERDHPGSNLMYFDQDGYIRVMDELPGLFGMTDTRRIK